MSVSEWRSSTVCFYLFSMLSPSLFFHCLVFVFLVCFVFLSCCCSSHGIFLWVIASFYSMLLLSLFPFLLICFICLLRYFFILVSWFFLLCCCPFHCILVCQCYSISWPPFKPSFILISWPSSVYHLYKKYILCSVRKDLFTAPQRPFSLGVLESFVRLLPFLGRYLPCRYSFNVLCPYFTDSSCCFFSPCSLGYSFSCPSSSIYSIRYSYHQPLSYPL